MAVDYLLQEDGFRIELEDSSGFLILDSTGGGPVWVVGSDHATSYVVGSDSISAKVVGSDRAQGAVVDG